MLPSTLLIIVAGLRLDSDEHFAGTQLPSNSSWRTNIRSFNIHIKLRPQNLHFASCTHCTLLHQELPLAPPPFADSPTSAQWRALGLVDFRKYLWIFLNVHWNNIDLNTYIEIDLIKPRGACLWNFKPFQVNNLIRPKAPGSWLAIQDKHRDPDILRNLCSCPAHTSRTRKKQRMNCHNGSCSRLAIQNEWTAIKRHQEPWCG